MKKKRAVMQARDQRIRAENLLNSGDAPAARALFEASLRKDIGSADALLGLGQACLALEDFAEARQAFKRAARRDDRHAAPLLGLAQTLIRELARDETDTFIAAMPDDFSDAHLDSYDAIDAVKDLLDRAVALDPHDLEARLERGAWLNECFCDDDTGIEDLRLVLDAGPLPLPVLSRIGAGLVDAGDEEAGLALLAQVERFQPLDAHALWVRIQAREYPELYDPACVKADYEALLALMPEDLRTLDGYARFLEEADDHEDRAAVLARMVALEPDSFRYQHDYALALCEISDHEASLPVFDAALALEPENARAWYHRGNAYRILERYPEALHDYTKAILYDPTCAYAYNNRGFVHEVMGQEALKLEDWLTGISVNPENHILNRNLAQHYSNAEAWEQVLAYTAPLLEKRPYDRAGLVERGRALRHLDRVDEAMETLQRAVETWPEDVNALNERGITYGKQGHRVLQIADCRAALRVSPGDKGVMYNLAVRLAQTGEAAEALPLFEDLAARAPDRASCVAWRGECHRLLGRPAVGLSDLERAVALDPEDAHIALCIGRAHRDLGAMAEAIAAFERALALDPDSQDARDELDSLQEAV